MMETINILEIEIIKMNNYRSSFVLAVTGNDWFSLLKLKSQINLELCNFSYPESLKQSIMLIYIFEDLPPRLALIEI